MLNRLWMYIFFICMLACTWEKVIVREQKGTNGNSVTLCFDDAEQVFDYMRADGSIVMSTFSARSFSPQELRLVVCLSSPSGTRCGVKSCCVAVSYLLSQQLFFLSSFFRLLFHYSPRQRKKEKRYWLLFMLTGGFGAAILEVRVTLCKPLRNGRKNQCFRKVE